MFPYVSLAMMVMEYPASFWRCCPSSVVETSVLVPLTLATGLLPATPPAGTTWTS